MLNWNINCDGVLINITALDTIKLIWLNISVNDTIGNLNSAEFWINITEAPVIVLRKCTTLLKVLYNNPYLPKITECL